VYVYRAIADIEYFGGFFIGVTFDYQAQYFFFPCCQMIDALLYTAFLDDSSLNTTSFLRLHRLFQLISHYQRFSRKSTAPALNAFAESGISAWH